MQAQENNKNERSINQGNEEPKRKTNSHNSSTSKDKRQVIIPKEDKEMAEQLLVKNT